MKKEKMAREKGGSRMKKILVTTLSVMFLLSLTSSIDAKKPMKTEVFYVPNDYFTIQEAVDASDPGKLTTIIVDANSGPYERVIIRVEDAYINLIGGGALIHGGNFSAIALETGAHHISISGFDLTSNGVSATSGITDWMRVQPLHHITIHHNNIYGNFRGIYFGRWNQPQLHYNITIQHNKIFNNSAEGIHLWRVTEAILAHNEILNNQSVSWAEVTNSIATNNTISGNSSTGFSIGLGCSGNTVTNNTISDNGGIGLWFWENREGISGNTVTQNNINNNNFGIVLSGFSIGVTGNTFIQNDVLNNNSWDIYELGLATGNTWVMNKYDDALPDPPQ